MPAPTALWGLAGEMLQKFTNYRLRVPILGDHSQLIDRSDALRDLIRELNRGRSVWFLCDWDALAEKARTPGRPRLVPQKGADIEKMPAPLR